MGLFNNILDSISGKSSSDPKETSVTYKDGNVRVHNADVIIDHNTGTHDTVWSNTNVDGNTGKTSFDEGAHGPNFKP